VDVAAAAGAGQAYGLPYVDLERFLASLLVFAALAGYVLTPASSYVSRTFEVQSDAYSLQLTGDRAAFVSTQVSLAIANLGDVDPPPFIRWFAWTHPTTLERIRAASQP
jgi:STE24 endopeptidase